MIKLSPQMFPNLPPTFHRAPDSTGFPHKPSESTSFSFQSLKSRPGCHGASLTGRSSGGLSQPGDSTGCRREGSGQPGSLWGQRAQRGARAGPAVINLNLSLDPEGRSEQWWPSRASDTQLAFYFLTLSSEQLGADCRDSESPYSPSPGPTSDGSPRAT